MVRAAPNAQDANRQIFGEPSAKFSRRENCYLMSQLSNAARDINAISLKAAAGKQADDCKCKMHVLIERVS